MTTASSVGVGRKLCSPRDVIDFWFGDRALLNDIPAIQERMKCWFGSDESFQAVQHANVDLVERSFLGLLTKEDEEWRGMRGKQARILLHDQFSREVFRSSAKAFAGDAIAAELALEIIHSDDFTSEFEPIERLFITLPLMHAESLEKQKLLKDIVPRTLSGVTSPEMMKIVAPVDFMQSHYDVIARFGRFPSRNAAMGRTNTEEEEIYLNSPDLPGWAKSQMKRKEEDKKEI